MDKQILQGQRKSFSNDDIERLCEGEVNIYTYPKIASLESIDQLLNYPKKCNAAIVLYMTEKNYGHWVAIFKNAQGNIEFFDSYGFSPDDELKLIKKNFRLRSNQEVPHLSKLLKKFILDTGKQIVYNKIDLQSKKNDTATCGRWAGLRIALKEIPLNEFQKLFIKQTFPPDWYVSALTLFI